MKHVILEPQGCILNVYTCHISVSDRKYVHAAAAPFESKRGILYGQNIHASVYGGGLDFVHIARFYL